MISQASHCRPLKSSFDWRFSFSTMAKRIMTRNTNYRSALSTVKSQGVVNAKNFATRSVRRCCFSHSKLNQSSSL